ncbi:hypothetical protein UB46_16460 [Burkholderiaceae bacterium 16]|nr:hypothetical protein UB46_16460 [Burkholderiaceae bacterium 16]
MTTDKMKKATGVYSRTGSSIWQWRIGTPKDLRHLYMSDWAHRRSLGTSDLREANLKATQLRAQWLARFDEQRIALNPQSVEQITPAMATFLAEQMLHNTLREDEDRRTKPDEQAWLLQWMRGMGMAGADAPSDQLGGMPDALADMLEDLHVQHDAEAGKALARGKLVKALPGMLHVAQQAGIAFDKNTPGVREALQEYQKAVKQATSLKVQRDQGAIVETPPAPDLKAIEVAKKQPKLRDVFDLWREAKKRGKDAIEKTERALVMFEKQSGNPALKTIKREDGITFQSWLLKQDLASKTQHDNLTWVKSLLNFANRDLEWIERNPWAGLNIAYKTENKRSPWTTAQLQTFFSLPLFTRYELPTQQKAGKDAAYWIPLLGLFTGARIGELCQLRVADVVTRDDQAFISINDDGEGSTVKTAAGIRDIPVHSELVRLGFLEYVEATRQARHERLWPDLTLRKDKPGGNFSNWFGEARKLLAVDVPDFHSLRHTVRTKMTEAGIAEAVQDRITGHEVKGSVGSKVYSHPVAILRTAVEAITYPGLVLNKVYG